MEISKYLTEFLFANGYGKANRRGIYEYGFECAASLIVNTVIMISIGFICGIPAQTASYMVCYIMLRNATGGAHLSSHKKCMLFYMGVALISIQTMGWIKNMGIGIAPQIALIVFSIWSVCRYAPVESANKKLSDELRKHLRERSLLMVGILSTCFLLLSIWMPDNQMVAAGITGMTVQSLLLLPIFNKL